MAQGKNNDWTREITDEAIRLICGLRFSTNRGGTMRGEHVHVIADPAWEEEVQAYRLALLCHVPGLNMLNWEGMPIVISNEAGSNLPSYIARLDARGYAVVPALPPGEYKCRATATWLNSREPVVDLHPVENMPERLAAAGEAEQPTWPVLPAALNSNDARLLVTPEQAADGGLRLTVETHEIGLANARVFLAIADSNGAVMQETEVKLSRHGERELWLGYWAVNVTSPAPGMVIAQLLPGDSKA